MKNVLKPIYKDTGLVDKDGEKIYNVAWKVVGQARNIEEAKKIIPCPVLDENTQF